MKNTIAKIGLSRDSKNNINISISDGHSGDRIAELKLNLEQYALFTTGLHGVSAECEINNNARIACKREVKHVEMPCDGKVTKNKVIIHFLNSRLNEDDWMIHSDGISSQQNKRGVHTYVIKRYLEVDNWRELDRY